MFSIRVRLILSYILILFSFGKYSLRPIAVEISNNLVISALINQTYGEFAMTMDGLTATFLDDYREIDSAINKDGWSPYIMLLMIK